MASGEQLAFGRVALGMPISRFKAGQHNAFRRAAIGRPVATMTAETLGGMRPPVTGYYDWWDATDATSLSLFGSGVVTWTSKGSNAAVLTNNDGSGHGSGITTGTRTLNSLNVLDCDAANYFQVGTYAAQPLTVFFVFKMDGTTSTTLMDGGAGRNTLAVFAGQYYMYAGGSELTGGTSDTSSHVIAAVFNGASSTVHVDGVSVISGNPGAANLDVLRMARLIDGYIGEILVYNSALGVGNRQFVEAYLKAKWGTP